MPIFSTLKTCLGKTLLKQKIDKLNFFQSIVGADERT